ncbi:MAG: O-antigen ligase family protein [bacterium]|nr:O-antigen ligase family protein [bacterium]
MLVKILLGISILVPPLFDGGTTHLPATILRLSSLGLAFYYINEMLKKGSASARLGGLSCSLFFLVYMILIAAILSPYQYLSLQFFGLVANYVFFFFLITIFLEPEINREVIRFLILSGLIQSAWAYWHFFSGGVPRPKGGFFNPNELAGYLVPIAGISLSFLGAFLVKALKMGKEKDGSSAAPPRSDRNVVPSRWPVLSWSAIFIFISGAIMITASRGGNLAFFFMAGIILWFYFRWRLLYLIFPLTLIFILVPNPFMERLVNIGASDPFAYSRIGIWKASIRIFLDHPLGVGPEMYQYYSPLYVFPVDTGISRYLKFPERAHNEYLNFLVELGICGGVFMAWFLLLIGGKAVKFFRHTRENLADPETVIKIGMVGGMIAILLHALVESNFHNPPIALTFFIFLGLIFRDDGKVFEIRLAPLKKYRYYLIALTVLLTVVILKPALAYWEFVRGNQAMNRNETDNGIKYFKRAAFFCDGVASAHFSLGAAAMVKLRETGQEEWLDLTLNEYEISTRLNPFSYDAYESLGTMYGAAGLKTHSNSDYALAIENFQQVLKRKPFSPQMRRNVGYMYLNMGKTGEAEFWIREALKLEPNFLDAIFLLGIIHEKRGDLKKSRTLYLRVIDLYNKYRSFQTGYGYEKDLLRVNMREVESRLRGVESRLK